MTLQLNSKDEQKLTREPNGQRWRGRAWGARRDKESPMSLEQGKSRSIWWRGWTHGQGKNVSPYTLLRSYYPKGKYRQRSFKPRHAMIYYVCFEKITMARVWRSDWKRITVDVGIQEGTAVSQE